jgi:hypothetical protein
MIAASEWALKLMVAGSSAESEDALTLDLIRIVVEIQKDAQKDLENDILRLEAQIEDGPL